MAEISSRSGSLESQTKLGALIDACPCDVRSSPKREGCIEHSRGAMSPKLVRMTMYKSARIISFRPESSANSLHVLKSPPVDQYHLEAASWIGHDLIDSALNIARCIFVRDIQGGAVCERCLLGCLIRPWTRFLLSAMIRLVELVLRILLPLRLGLYSQDVPIQVLHRDLALQIARSTCWPDGSSTRSMTNGLVTRAVLWRHSLNRHHLHTKHRYLILQLAHLAHIFKLLIDLVELVLQASALT